MAEKMRPAFIHILLCDNDYGQELGAVAHMVHDHCHQPTMACDPEEIKYAVIDIINGMSRLKAASRGWANMDSLPYLRSRLSVVFSDVVPNVDHNGGSVAIDRNTGYIWRF